jgi:viroplasmin and RNaseH domain-containing protein
MPDGPNIEHLFTETDCLNAQSNLKDIVKYLRFFRDETAYQMYLKKFLPKLADPKYKEAFDEFIGDLEDKEMSKDLKELVKEKPVEPVVAPVIETVVTKIETPVKKGKKKTS